MTSFCHETPSFGSENKELSPSPLPNCLSVFSVTSSRPDSSDRTHQQGQPEVFSLGLQQLGCDIVYFGARPVEKGFGGIFEL